MPVFPTERGGFEMEQRKKGKERGSSSFLQAVFLGTGGIRRAVLMLTCHPVCFASSRQLQLQVGAQRHTKHGRRRGISTCVRPKPSVTVGMPDVSYYPAAPMRPSWSHVSGAPVTWFHRIH